MATTTPNFGWSVPTSTDLVKDGATAIETLGDAIDASLVDLKGGTTGQVLKKNSNTDMDFVWSADSAGMTNPMTTTGDTIYSSSGSTPARLGIGSTGQVLTVSGGLPAWATPSSGSMTLLSTTSMAGVTTVTISSISQDYTHLQILLEDFDFNANDKNIGVRFNGNSSSVYYGTYDSTNANSFGTWGQVDNWSATNDGNFVAMDVPFYSNANIMRYSTHHGGGVSSTGAGYYIGKAGYTNFSKATPAALTSITFFNSTDTTNFDAGSIKVYGVK